MIANNIFRWIGSLFTDLLFIPFDWFRKGDFNWWSSNTVNWIFLAVLLVLFWYWMKESAKFLREGTEDRA
ncbi:DUF6341 family protein [Polaribacter aquimarinus]|uniref:Uracil phosphoribosyltransferase n=1 Tax=Polaribacter aquimarinus TaxID=2100726 RepID=A0A2U2JCF8_9FLAO|nr:hypothetical protein [Polaribacter aquimarinus]PWG06036.1 hypothetical protein DIS07_06280 [Polaribacter aquimarinus]